MVQRYEFIDNAPWENPTGKWVRQVDHAAELATLRAENERLRERIVAAEYVLKNARPESGYWDTYAKEALK